jgi:hypothetical protein
MASLFENRGRGLLAVLALAVGDLVLTELLHPTSGGRPGSSALILGLGSLFIAVVSRRRWLEEREAAALRAAIGQNGPAGHSWPVVLGFASAAALALGALALLA